MRKIKFRAETTERKIIFSECIEWDEVNGEKFPFLQDDSDIWHRCKPDTLSLFVGCDCAGNEVYEGDILIDNENAEYIATLDSMLTWTNDPHFRYWHLPFNRDAENNIPTKMPLDFVLDMSQKIQKTDLKLKECSK